MSILFFERIRRLMPDVLKSLSGNERHQLDKEAERITGKDCDEIALRMKDREFEELVRKALKRLRAKKQEKRKEEEPIAA